MVLFFYLFATLLILGALFVVNSKNAVYSVLWLIFTFCNASGLMLLLGAEFLAFTLVIVYVGAVAVLFLFVVMMLDIEIKKFKTSSSMNVKFSYFLGICIFIDLLLVLFAASKYKSFANYGFTIPSNITNTEVIGKVLYTDFFLPFQTAGIILFVAMIACITLTLKHNNKAKKQNHIEQISKSKESNLVFTNPKLGKGIEGLKYE